MNYEEFKSLILKKAKEKKISQEMLKRLISELFHAEIYYNKIGDLYEDLKRNGVKNNLGVIPYFLGITKEVNLAKPIILKQTEIGGSGGIDIDSDIQNREKVIDYLKEKYGNDCVIPVGTISTLQQKVAIKDLLRYANASVADANLFTSVIDDEKSYEENIEQILKGDSQARNIYIKYKKFLDLVPHFLNKARGVGTHAGGVVLTPEPIWKYCPVEKSRDETVTAFVENGGNTELDSLGLVKLDLLGISVLDTIAETFNLIDEDLYIIEEDGLTKIVPKSYLEIHKDEIERCQKD